MTHTIYNCIRLSILALGLVGSLLWTQAVAAQVVVTDGDLRATFSSDPLFAAPATADLAPMAVRTATVTVENLGSNTETVLLAATNTSSTGLAEAIELRITEAGASVYGGTFADVFATTSISLKTLLPGATQDYSMTATFVGSSNQYQGTTMAFDLLVGFASGASVTTNTGGTTGTRVRPPTPGTSNNPDGQVAGIADGLNVADGVWPWWEEAIVAIREVFTPERESSAIATRVNRTATGNTENGDQPNTVADTATGSVAGMSAIAEAQAEQLCVLLWFILLALLGLVGRYLVPEPSAALQTVFARQRTLYLLMTVGYLVSIYVVSFTVGVSLVWGWVLVIAWVLYNGFDYVINWWQLESVSNVRIALLVLGSGLLFTLPNWTSWLCLWW